MLKWSPVVICWLAGFTIIAGIVGVVAWMLKSIGRAVRLGTPQTHT